MAKASSAEDKALSDRADDMEKPEAGETPPSGLLRGYTQTYLVWKPRAGQGQAVDGSGAESKTEQCEHEVLFRCGNWCYTGHVVLGRDMNLKDIPLSIPLLQRQQSRLHYYCNASSIPTQSNFSAPMKFMTEVSDFAAAALASRAVNEELERWSEVYRWMEEKPHESFFEVQTDSPPFMDGISLLASKTYARGLIFITVYFEGTFYISVADGEGDQPLLDVRFPDVSHHGEGLQLISSHEGTPQWFLNMSLWHAMPSEIRLTPPPSRNLSSDSYMQMYIVMRPRAENGGFSVTSAYREVLFRFGSWCYGGSVQLTPVINLADIPHVIPALRLQQSRLEYVYSADQVPSTSPYVKPMSCMLSRGAVMEREIEGAEDVLSKLVERLTAMGLGESISTWLEGDSSQSFFEFQAHAGSEDMQALRSVELIANKCYYASGVVLVTIYFQGTFYVTLTDAAKEQPLLDSKFPNVASKGRGYQIRAYADGVKEWPSLRKVSVWQTTAAMQREMEERMAKVEAAEAAGGRNAAEAVAIAEQRASKAAEDELRKQEQDETANTRDQRCEDSPGHAAPAKETPRSEHAADKVSAAGAKEAKAHPAEEDKGVAPSKTPEKQSLGAFHRLAPMAGMEKRLSELRTQFDETTARAPWDKKGVPLGLGKSPSPFGKGATEFKG